MSSPRRRIRMWSVDTDAGASTRYRVLAHVPALEAAGFGVEVSYPVGDGRRGRPWRAMDLLRDRWRSAGDDILFVHRKTYPAPFDRGLARRAGPMVFDFDDAIDLPPPGRPAEDDVVARYRDNFERTAAAADLVLAGNAELARRVPHDRVRIVPTAVDTTRFRPGAVAAPVPGTLGWVGHSDNLPYLERLADPLRNLASNHPGLRVVVVADRPPDLPGVPVEFRRWTLGTELSSFDEIAIGLMPLDDTPWARSKCAFKALQYMSLGIPAVCSPVGMNAEVVRDGECGFLAGDAASWSRVLDRLLMDPDLAMRVGAAGRDRVEATYSLAQVSSDVVKAMDALVEGAALVGGPREG